MSKALLKSNIRRSVACLVSSRRDRSSTELEQALLVYP